MTIYTERGYRNRDEYLRAVALEHGVPLQAVLLAADILGPNEDFDGLISAMEDYAEADQ
jgi:hypothetical protein